MSAAACVLCGGNAGTLNDDGAHNLCAARKRLDLPTPSLGQRCATCNGSGIKPRPDLAGKALPVYFTPGDAARGIAAIFKPCADCRGRGHTGEAA